MYLLLLAVGCTPDPTPAAKPTAVPSCTLDGVGLALTYTPTATVEVVTDDRGIRHLYAQNDADLFWAAGYQIAEDRLFQLDTWRRLSRGTLAEVQGEDEVDSDLAARTFAFGRYACESVAWMAQDRPEDIALVVAYVEGLNRRIAEVQAGEAEPPPEFTALGYAPEAWTILDVFTIGRRINLGYSNSVEFDLLYGLMTELVANFEDFPVFAPGAPRYITTDTAPEAVARPAPRRGAARGTGTLDAASAEGIRQGLATMRDAFGMGPGSNNWAVNGAYTDNGRPLLANDPHSGYDNPNTLWQVHLNSADAGGTFDVIGFAFPGVPGVQLGHNRALAWSATTAMADQTDLWAVTVDDGAVNLGGKSVAVTEEEEIIRVKLDDGSVEERAFTIRRVEGYGVILPEDLLPVPPTIFGGELLVNWVGFQPTDEIFGYFDFDRAQDLDDFEAAVDYEKVGLHNWVGATAEGIRYRVHGWLPQRGEAGARPPVNRVMDGTDASTLWTGQYMDTELLPRLDGTQPFIVTANNDPFGITDDNDPLNDERYYASFFAPSFRADRIHAELDRLVAEGPVTAEQMMTLQLDSYSSLAAGLVPHLDAAVARIDTDEDLAEYRGRADLVEAAARLSAWDRHMDRDSEEAALFRAWEGYVAKRTLASDLSILFGSVEEAQAVAIAKINLITYDQDLQSILRGNTDRHLLAALDDALEWTRARAAEEGVPWTWGVAHAASFEPVWGELTYVAVDGDDSAVNVSQCAFWDGSEPADVCVAPEGAIFRQVTTFDAEGTPVMWASVPFGGDGDVSRWQAGTYDVVPFARADVDARATTTGTLGP